MKNNNNILLNYICVKEKVMQITGLDQEGE